LTQATAGRCFFKVMTAEFDPTKTMALAVVATAVLAVVMTVAVVVKVLVMAGGC